MGKLVSFFKRKKLPPWAGIVGTVLFISVFTVEGWIRNNYDSFEMYISELSLGPRGWIQIANFIIFGILLLVFTIGIIDEFKGIRGSKLGPIIIAVIGISFIVAGIFIIDVSGEGSLSGLIHNISASLIFLLASVSCFVFFHLFQEKERWRKLSWWTLTVGVAIIILVVLMEVDGTFLASWPGLTQRMAAIIGFVWIFVFALRILRENNDNKRPGRKK